MNQSEILVRILLTVVFGAILGLETETREIQTKGAAKANKEEKSRLGGIRTYTILCLIGGVAGLLFTSGEFILTYITFIGLIALVVAAYIENIQIRQAFGLTTEIAILITFLIGFLTTSNFVAIEVNLVILVLLTFFLSQKRGVGKLIQNIQHEELIDVTKFGLISIVALPVLPDQNYRIADLLKLISSTAHFPISDKVQNLLIINPFEMWLIVVIISGIGLASYLLSKAVGRKKGILLTSIFGGLISSTSTTVALAHESKESKEDKSSLYAGAAVVSTAASFLTTASLLIILNLDLFKKVSLALLAMTIIGMVVGTVIMISDKDNRKSTAVKFKHRPFSISPAIKFALIIIILRIVIQILAFTGSNVILVGVTALTGAAGLDASTIAIADLVNNNGLALNIAALMFLLTNVINLLAKVIYGDISGNRNFSVKLLIGLALTALGTFAVFL